MSMPRLVAGWLTIAILALLFAATVWPTVYRYDHAGNCGQGAPCLLRIHRITGSVDWLDAHPRVAGLKGTHQHFGRPWRALLQRHRRDV